MKRELPSLNRLSGTLQHVSQYGTPLGAVLVCTNQRDDIAKAPLFVLEQPMETDWALTFPAAWKTKLVAKLESRHRTKDTRKRF